MKAGAHILHNSKFYIEIIKSDLENLPDGLCRQSIIDGLEQSLKTIKENLRIVDPENTYYNQDIFGNEINSSIEGGL